MTSDPSVSDLHLQEIKTKSVTYKTRWVTEVSMYPPCVSWQVGGQVWEEETELNVS